VSNDGLPEVRAVIDPAFTIADLDPRIAGSFVEHMGRAIYGGLWEPGHPTADADGWRGDVLELVRELGPTIVRYPGGNFLSGYDWEDGIGPREERPIRLDLAWRSLEPNLVGTDEFLAWARLAGVEALLAVNLGTRGVDAARAMVEYVNRPAGSRWADRRVANGHPEPWGVHTWCLGNEMDGHWQIGQKTAVEYGRLAAEAGKAMKLVDPTIELVLAGSSGAFMPTFGAWDDTVLDLAFEVTDHLSVHAYFDETDSPDLDHWLAVPLAFERHIRSVAAIADAVAARRRSRRRIGLAVDEWNVWHQSRNRHTRPLTEDFVRAPGIAEDEYSLADALMVGGLLLALLRNADRVRIACLAQLVNVIAPIRTRDGGPAWREATFFPVRDMFRAARGTVLRVEPAGPTYRTTTQGDVPALDGVAILDPSGERLTLLLLNRVAGEVAFRAPIRDMGPMRVCRHTVLTGPDPGAINTPDRPDAVVPVAGHGASMDGGQLRVTLPGRSWTVIELGP
jgi:alpha-N-arabinofuranosidase